MERNVLSAAFGFDIGSERYFKFQARSKMLGLRGSPTFEGKAAAALAYYAEAMTKGGFIGDEPDEPDLEAVLRNVCEHNRLYIEAGKLSDSPSWRSYAVNMMHPAGLGTIPITSYMHEWDPDCFDCSEDGVIKAIAFYQYHVCGPALKAKSMFMDYFRAGQFTVPLALWYGNLDALITTYDKLLVAYEEVNMASTSSFKEDSWETTFACFWCTCPALALVGLHDEALCLLKAAGFTLDAEGFENYDKLCTWMKGAYPPWRPEIEKIGCRLFLVALSSSLDETEINAWMPSPKELADLEKNYRSMQVIGLYDITSLGAKVFLKLGRHDEADELARIAVAPEQQTKKKTTLVACHCIIGQIAAKRGLLDEAQSHFLDALEAARLSRLPMMEVLTAREWKRCLLEAHRQDCSAAEAVIDGACAKMKKSRAQIAHVLTSKWYKSMEETCGREKTASILESGDAFYQTMKV